jgi:hypothetical protein
MPPPCASRGCAPPLLRIAEARCGGTNTSARHGDGDAATRGLTSTRRTRLAHRATSIALTARTDRHRPTPQRRNDARAAMRADSRPPRRRAAPRHTIFGSSLDGWRGAGAVREGACPRADMVDPLTNVTCAVGVMAHAAAVALPRTPLALVCLSICEGVPPEPMLQVVAPSTHVPADHSVPRRQWALGTEWRGRGRAECGTLGTEWRGRGRAECGTLATYRWTARLLAASSSLTCDGVRRLAFAAVAAAAPPMEATLSFDARVLTWTTTQ